MAAIAAGVMGWDCDSNQGSVSWGDRERGGRASIGALAIPADTLRAYAPFCGHLIRCPP